LFVEEKKHKKKKTTTTHSFFLEPKWFFEETLQGKEKKGKDHNVVCLF
jgi:hypothetical protein